MADIVKTRQVINQIDEEMASLFEKRMDAVKEIAAYKIANKLAIFDDKREKEILASCAQRIKNPLYRDYYLQFIQDTMQISKQFQQTLIEPAKVGYQGALGAFSHIASSNLFPSSKLFCYPSFEEVFEKVENKELDYGVIPFENSFAGDVSEVYDYLRKYNVNIQEVYSLHIDQNLLVKKGTKIEDIKDVYSKDQALDQCSLFLKKRNWILHTYPNTALAAQLVGESDNHSMAAIASKATAKIYDLEIIASDINTSSNNTTKFVVISTKELKSASRFNMLFTLKHDTGTLAKAINHISKAGYNMECIKSFPQKDIPWAYYFYVEVVGDLFNPNSKELIENIKKDCLEFKVIGSYNIKEEEA